MNNRTGILSTVEMIFEIIYSVLRAVLGGVVTLAVIAGLGWVVISLIRWFWSNPLF